MHIVFTLFSLICYCGAVSIISHRDGGKFVATGLNGGKYDRLGMNHDTMTYQEYKQLDLFNDQVFPLVNDPSHPPGPGEAIQIIQVEAGPTMLASDGSLWAMGYNADDRGLHDEIPTEGTLTKPVQIRTGINAVKRLECSFADIDDTGASKVHCFALTNGGGLAHFGDNAHGQLAYHSPASNMIHRFDISIVKDVVDVATSFRHSLVCMYDPVGRISKVIGTGEATHGELGPNVVDKTDNTYMMIWNSTTVNCTAVQVAYQRSFIVTDSPGDDKLLAFGDNTGKKLGLGPTYDVMPTVSTPTPVMLNWTMGETVFDVEGGRDFTLVRTNHHRMFIFGHLLGLGRYVYPTPLPDTTRYASTPIQFAFVPEYHNRSFDLTAGYYHFSVQYGSDTSFSIYTYGNNTNSQVPEPNVPAGADGAYSLNIVDLSSKSPAGEVLSEYIINALALDFSTFFQCSPSYMLDSLGQVHLSVGHTYKNFDYDIQTELSFEGVSSAGCREKYCLDNVKRFQRAMLIPPEDTIPAGYRRLLFTQFTPSIEEVYSIHDDQRNQLLLFNQTAALTLDVSHHEIDFAGDSVDPTRPIRMGPVAVTNCMCPRELSFSCWSDISQFINYADRIDFSGTVNEYIITGDQVKCMAYSDAPAAELSPLLFTRPIHCAIPKDDDEHQTYTYVSLKYVADGLLSGIQFSMAPHCTAPMWEALRAATPVYNGQRIEQTASTSSTLMVYVGGGHRVKSFARTLTMKMTNGAAALDVDFDLVPTITSIEFVPTLTSDVTWTGGAVMFNGAFLTLVDDHCGLLVYRELFNDDGEPSWSIVDMKFDWGISQNGYYGWFKPVGRTHIPGAGETFNRFYIGICSHMDAPARCLNDVNHAKLYISTAPKPSLADRLSAYFRARLPIMIVAGAIVCLTAACGLTGMCGLLQLRARSRRIQLQKLIRATHNFQNLGDKTQAMIEHSATKHYLDSKLVTVNFAMSLGEGAQGVVYRGSYKQTSLFGFRVVTHDVAIKFPAAQDDDSIMALGAELNSIAGLNNRHIVGIHGMTFKPKDRGGDPSFAIVSELCTEGSYFAFIKANNDGGRPVLQADKLRIGLEAAEGIAFLHSKGIAHQDIKPDNVLITLRGETPTAKVGDFGTVFRNSRRGAGLLQTDVQLGTSMFTAPEKSVINQPDIPRTVPKWLKAWYPSQRAFNKQLQQADVFSFGLTLWCMIVGEMPIAPIRNGQRHSVEFAMRHDNWRPDLLTVEFTPQVADLVASCWAPVTPGDGGRPCMKTVVRRLKAAIAARPSPTHPITPAPEAELDVESRRESMAWVDPGEEDGYQLLA